MPCKMFEALKTEVQLRCPFFRLFYSQYRMKMMNNSI